MYWARERASTGARSWPRSGSRSRGESWRERSLTVTSPGVSGGVIDGLEAQFSLLPLEGEPSCREDLYPFDREAKVGKGELIRYRPLGCPIVHFARVLSSSHGILKVHIIGPQRIIVEGAEEPHDIGMCMVAAFEGVLGRGKMPRVGQTVRFLPQHCMMGKVHSGVVVGIEGSRLRIEGIDLKVW